MSRIVVFTSEADGALARIEVPAPSLQKGKARVEWLPAIVHAATADEARDKAQAFYDAELERYARKEAGVAKRVEGLKAYRAAKAVSA